MVRYYKKVTEYNNFVQPTLSSNGTLGGNSFAVEGNGAGGSASTEVYTLFKSSDGWFQARDGGYITIYNPIPLIVSKIDLVYYTADTAIGATIYGSNDNTNWIKLTTFNHTTKKGTVAINNTTAYKYFKLNNIDGHGNNGYGTYNIGDVLRITITAQVKEEKWQECTKAEYDTLPDDERKILQNVYNAFVKKSGYELVEDVKPWTQPARANISTTPGGESFAVSASYEYSSNTTAINMFESNNVYGWSGHTAVGDYIIWYNPKPLNITSLTFSGGGSSNADRITSFDFYGSTDNSTWTKIDSYTRTSTISAVTVNTNSSEYYKYNKLVVTGYVSRAIIRNLTIEATQKVSKLIPTTTTTTCYAFPQKNYKSSTSYDEAVNSYVSNSVGVVSATGVEKLSNAQALSIINGGQQVMSTAGTWTAEYNFKDKIAIQTFGYNTGFAGDGYGYLPALTIQAYVNNTWTPVYSENYSASGNNQYLTRTVNSSTFSNRYRFIFTGGTVYSGGGIVYYSWLQNLTLNVLKKVVSKEGEYIKYYLGGGKQKMELVEVERPWLQPTLTTPKQVNIHGTLGGDSFAANGYDANGNETYYSYNGGKMFGANAFDFDTNTRYYGQFWRRSGTSTTAVTGCYLCWYNPYPIKLTGLKIEGNLPQTFKVQGTNNYSVNSDNWIDLGTFSPANTNEWSSSINNNNYFKYYRILITAPATKNFVDIEQVYITAVKKITVLQKNNKERT